eukprot:COSAG05_NODE_3750_length_1862_cov_1.591605_1_plen_70_part_00
MNTHHVYCIVQGFVAGAEEGGRMAAMRGPSSFVEYKEKVAAMQQQQQQDAEAKYDRRRRRRWRLSERVN